MNPKESIWDVSYMPPKECGICENDRFWSNGREHVCKFCGTYHHSKINV